MISTNYSNFANCYKLYSSSSNEAHSAPQWQVGTYNTINVVGHMILLIVSIQGEIVPWTLGQLCHLWLCSAHYVYHDLFHFGNFFLRIGILWLVSFWFVLILWKSVKREFWICACIICVEKFTVFTWLSFSMLQVGKLGLGEYFIDFYFEIPCIFCSPLSFIHVASWRQHQNCTCGNFTSLCSQVAISFLGVGL
jgi:hypothetical protein